jgi:hypothetical protein
MDFAVPEFTQNNPPLCEEDVMLWAGEEALQMYLSSDKFAYILSAALGVFDGSALDMFKDSELYEDFRAYGAYLLETVDTKLGLKRAADARKSNLVDLSGDVDFEWDKDANGNVYLQKIRDEVVSIGDKEKKKGLFSKKI